MSDYMALKEEDIEAEEELIKEYQLTLKPRSAQRVSTVVMIDLQRFLLNPFYASV